VISFRTDLSVREACMPPALDLKELVATAIASERPPVTVEPVAVDLHGDTLPAPYEVDLVVLTAKQNPGVHPGLGQSTVTAESEHGLLEVALRDRLAGPDAPDRGA